MKQAIEFQFEELRFTPEFQTETSISFSAQNTGDNLGRGAIRGWIDVHYPCDGHIKVQIRGALPERLLNFENLRDITSAVTKALSIPDTETFETLYFKQMNAISIEQPLDKDGKTDRISTTRKWTLPKNDS